MKQDLNKFLIFYNFNRGHGGLRKEIKVRTPYEALEYWYNLKPDLFIRKPDYIKVVGLCSDTTRAVISQQPKCGANKIENKGTLPFYLGLTSWYAGLNID
jgi:hypothetical protein